MLSASISALLSVYRYANVTLGQRCILDQTTYLEFGPNGQQLSHTISRHNCRSPLLFCDPSSLQCFHTKPVGTPCEADLECRSVSKATFQYNFADLGHEG